MSEWREHIVCSPDTLWGKPRVAGTRIGVEFLLDLLASGWTEAQILEQYPQLTPQHLQAVFAFVRDSMKDLSYLSTLAPSLALPERV